MFSGTAASVLITCREQQATVLFPINDIFRYGVCKCTNKDRWFGDDIETIANLRNAGGKCCMGYSRHLTSSFKKHQNKNVGVRIRTRPLLFEQKDNADRILRVSRGTVSPLQSSAPDRRAQIPGIPIRISNTPNPVAVVLISRRRGWLCTRLHRTCKPTVNIVYIEKKCPRCRLV